MSQAAAIEILRDRLGDRPTLKSRAHEWLHGRRLDDELASGADPSTDRALTLHAYRLLMPRSRARIADGLETAWRDAGRSHGLSAKAPLAREAILAAGPELESLIAELRTDDRCDPRGVALARMLLIDASSPLYAPGSEEELIAALERAYRALRLGDGG